MTDLFEWPQSRTLDPLPSWEAALLNWGAVMALPMGSNLGMAGIQWGQSDVR
jgi:hypothetical protein